jgi:hypothetical protein
MGKVYQQLYPVHFGNRTGYIDQQGEIVISPKGFYGHDFCEGFAVVEMLDRDEFNFGYLMDEGRIHIHARFLRADAFRERMGRVEIRHGKYSFVDTDGHEMRHIFSAACSFSEGLAAVRTDDEWGYINCSGELVVQPRFTHAGEFSEGLAAATTNGHAGYIDRSGNWAIAQSYQQASLFSAGRAAVQIDGRFGYIDRENNWIVKPAYDFAWPHREGLAHVQEGKFHGFIDLVGKEVVPFIYDDAGDFSEGFAPVRIGKKWGYVDALGRMVIEPRFLKAGPFQGIARVVVDELVEAYPITKSRLESAEAVEVSNYINKVGEAVWQWPSFFDGEPYPKDIGYKRARRALLPTV